MLTIICPKCGHDAVLSYIEERVEVTLDGNGDPDWTDAGEEDHLCIHDHDHEVMCAECNHEAPFDDFVQDVPVIEPPKPDIMVSDHGSIFLIHPWTDAGKAWIDENIPDDAMYYANALAVEARYVENIVEGMKGDGLIVD